MLLMLFQTGEDQTAVKKKKKHTNMLGEIREKEQLSEKQKII